VKGVVFHSDRGSEFSASLFGKACTALGVLPVDGSCPAMPMPPETVPPRCPGSPWGLPAGTGLPGHDKLRGLNQSLHSFGGIPSVQWVTCMFPLPLPPLTWAA
jgi:hypothetical protein